MGCRETADQADLVRFAAVAGELREGRTLPGRGAWLHPDRACFDAAVAGGGFARTLRQNVITPLDWTPTWPRSA